MSRFGFLFNVVNAILGVALMGWGLELDLFHWLMFIIGLNMLMLAAISYWRP